MVEHQNEVDENIAFLTTANGSIEAGLICSFLKENQVPFLTKQHGNGAVLNILSGYSIFDIDIFVPKNALELASQLLSDMQNGQEYTEEEILLMDGEEEEP